MRKTVILLLLIWIAACQKQGNDSQKASTRDRAGLAVVMSSTHNHHPAFILEVDNIFLVDSKGVYRKISRSEPFQVAFASLGDIGQLALLADVPVGRYDRVAIDFNLKNTLINGVDQGGIKSPVLLDSYGMKVKDHTEAYRLESNFDTQFPLVIEKGFTATLSFELDVDASTRWLFADEEGIDHWLISPVFHVSSLKTSKDATRFSGEVKAVRESSVVIEPVFGKALQGRYLDLSVRETDEISVQVDNEPEKPDVALNHMKINPKGLLSGIVDIRERKVRPLQLEYITASALFMYTGHVDRDSRFIGIEEHVMAGSRSLRYLNEPTDFDQGIAFIEQLSSIRGPAISPLQRLESYLLAEVVEKEAEALSVLPLALDALPASLFFREGELLKIRVGQTAFSVGDRLFFSGFFSRGSKFIPSGVSFPDDTRQRLFLQLPLESHQAMFSRIAEDGFVINNNNNEGLLNFLKWHDLPYYRSVETPVEQVVFAPFPESLSLLVERVQPANEQFHAVSKVDYIERVMQLVAKGYTASALIADGYEDGGSFIADKVRLILYGPGARKEETALLHNIGVIAPETQEYRVLAGGFFSKSGSPEALPLLERGLFSDPEIPEVAKEKYSGRNTQTAASPLSQASSIKHSPNPLASGGSDNVPPSSPVPLEQGDASVFAGNETVQAGRALRNLGLLNPEVGNYFNERLNKALKFGIDIRFSVNMHEFIKSNETLRVLLTETDPVAAEKGKILLDEYIGAIRRKDQVAEANSPLNRYFEEPGEWKNFLKDRLAAQTVDEFNEVLEMDFQKEESKRKRLVPPPPPSVVELMFSGGDAQNEKMRRLLLNNTPVFKALHTAYFHYLVATDFADDKKLQKEFRVSEGKADQPLRYSAMGKSLQSVLDDPEKAPEFVYRFNKFHAAALDAIGDDVDAPASDATTQRVLKNLRKALTTHNSRLVKKFGGFIPLAEDVLKPRQNTTAPFGQTVDAVEPENGISPRKISRTSLRDLDGFSFDELNPDSTTRTQGDQLIRDRVPSNPYDNLPVPAQNPQRARGR